MNDNSKELNNAFLPFFERALAQEHKNEVDGILEEVPYDELLLD